MQFLDRLLPLLVLLSLACSPTPERIGDYFPDEKGEKRIFHLLEQDQFFGSYTLETWSTADLPAENRLLFFRDPRHTSMLGRWHLVFKADSLLVEFPTTDLRIALFTFPVEKGESAWFQLEPGLKSKLNFPEKVKVSAGHFDQVVHLSFEADSIFLDRLQLTARDLPLRFDCWIAPFEGFVRFQSGHKKEDLHERY
jgi:hypothetical protein